MIEKKQEVLDFGSVAVLFMKKNVILKSVVPLRFLWICGASISRDGVKYILSHLICLRCKGTACLTSLIKGAPPRHSGAGLIERIVNTYMRRGVKSAYADRAITVLAEYLPEKYRLPYEGAGVESYVDVLTLESNVLFIPKSSMVSK